MRLMLTAALILFATSAAAQDAERFNLHCSEFNDETPQQLRGTIDHVFSLDLETMTVCRDGNPRCWGIERQGRFLELTYPFDDGDDDYEMFRLYDPETGWLTQVIRIVGQPGNSYGEAVCEVHPFASVMD
ncbi:MAG: hypothetical protein J0L52_08780 [Caulobacterales bacterium]|nr:hypothetical protein [Caulobacterales bacterium]